MQDGRGYIIVLSDDDVGTLLDYIAAGRRSEVPRYTQRRYNDLVLCINLLSCS